MLENFAFFSLLQKTLSPGVPSDTVLSFYVQAQKLVLAVYHLVPNHNNKYDIGARYQVSSYALPTALYYPTYCC